MRFEDERYVRLYTRTTPKVKLLSWEARTCLWELFRHVDRAGLLALDGTGPKGLAATLGIPLPVARRILPEWISNGVVRESDGDLILPRFLAAQEAAQSDAARKRTQRELAAARAIENTGPNDEMSRLVTAGHDVTDEVTLCLAVPCLTDPPKPPTGAVGFVEDREPGSVTRLRRDDGVFGQTQEAWREGIGEHTKLTVASLGRGEVQDLQRVIEHAEGRDGDALIAWVRDTALSFAQSSEARFGLTPRRCVDWLNAARPARASPSKPPQREGPSSRSYDTRTGSISYEEYEARLAARKVAP